MNERKRFQKSGIVNGWQDKWDPTRNQKAEGFSSEHGVKPRRGFRFPKLGAGASRRAVTQCYLASHKISGSKHRLSMVL